MSTSDIILLAVAFIALGFSLYRKYVKKNQGKTGFNQSRNTGSSFAQPSKDDDYEPYMKR